MDSSPEATLRILKKMRSPISVIASSPVITVGLSLKDAEKELIRKTLESVNGNKTKASEILKIGLRTLHRKIKDYQLDEKDNKES